MRRSRAGWFQVQLISIWPSAPLSSLNTIQAGLNRPQLKTRQQVHAKLDRLFSGALAAYRACVHIGDLDVLAALDARLFIPALLARRANDDGPLTVDVAADSLGAQASPLAGRPQWRGLVGQRFFVEHGDAPFAGPIAALAAGASIGQFRPVDVGLLERVQQRGSRLPGSEICDCKGTPPCLEVVRARFTCFLSGFPSRL